MNHLKEYVNEIKKGNIIVGKELKKVLNSLIKDCRLANYMMLY